MSCFSCFGSADEPDPRPAVKQKPTQQAQKQQQTPLTQAVAKNQQAGPQKPAGPQLQNSEQLAALTNNRGPPSKTPSDPFKAQADAQAARFPRPGAPAPGTPPKVARLSPQNNGTPAYMAIPPLGQPQNGKAKPSKGRPIPERRPLTDGFAAQLPPLEENNLQSSPPSFKGFLTENKKSNPSVLNTGDIWKPKLGGTQNRATPAGSQGSGGMYGRRDTEADSRSNFIPSEPAQSRSYDFEANGVERPLAKDNQGLSKFMTDPRAKVSPTTLSPTDTPLISEESTNAAMSAAEPSRLATRPVASRGSSLNSDSSPREAEARGGLRRTVSGNPAEQGLAGGELYEFVSQLGVGSTGITRLMKDKRTQELVAAKWVPHTAGEMLSVQVEREILNHRRLLHNNVVRFREVFATDDHLVIVTDYATAGSLSTHIESEGAIPEQTAKDFFRQLADGITYCHRLGIVHRNLRLEKLLLDGQPAFPVLKISGFAYSKAPALDSAPKSIVGGGPTYMAPEMLLATREGASYDGRALDVWSAGVCLYTMLTGNLPFKDPNEPGILSRKLMQRIVNCIFEFPGHLNLSEECRDLIAKILVPDPKKRIDSYSLSSHPWLAGTTLRKTPSIAISKQSESDISSVMERARRRKEARMAAQRANARSNGAFNEDLLDE